MENLNESIAIMFTAFAVVGGIVLVESFGRALCHTMVYGWRA